MSDDDADDSVPIMSTDREARELMGLFDLPAFARRGQDMEYSAEPDSPPLPRSTR